MAIRVPKGIAETDREKVLQCSLVAHSATALCSFEREGLIFEKDLHQVHAGWGPGRLDLETGTGNRINPLSLIAGDDGEREKRQEVQPHVRNFP